MRLTQLVISMYEWTGLPDTVDVRFLELALFMDGQAAFIKDPALGILGLRVTAAGNPSTYGIPLKRWVFGDNGYNMMCDETDSVMCFANYLRRPVALDTSLFARRIGELDETIGVNVNAQKTPILIVCNEQQRLTFQNLYEKYEGNVPVIWGDKGLDPKGVQCLQTDAPYVADQLYELKKRYNDEFLTSMGINSIGTKKERLTEAESMQVQGATVASRHSPIEMRRKACMELRKMWPDECGDAWCEFRPDFVAGIAQEVGLTDIETAKEGDPVYEPVYNGA
ncbi:MAG: hypothetical protein LUD47_00795 [Clostridia bacterium]|nr:hypothetical protein [Clostridia bacterium]